MTDLVKPQSSDDLMNGAPEPELILLAGKDGVGKSSAVVSLAQWVEQTQPAAKFYVIDTENKFRSALLSFGADAPHNISYYKTDNMNQVTAVTAEILASHKPGDWLAVESMSRVWERAQDLGYQAITGTAKAEYMERRRGNKSLPNTPQPADLWSIVKGAHDSAFLDLLTQTTSLNICLTTIVAKPKDQGVIKESADRKAVRFELGIDMGLEGAPRLPYYIKTLCMLEMQGGRVSCRVLRDNLSVLETPRVTFDVEGRKAWASAFYAACRLGGG